MSQSEKSAYYQAVKDTGFVFTKHYREYSTDELSKIFTSQKLAAGEPATAPVIKEPTPRAVGPSIPLQAQADPNEMAGVRLNTQPEDEPIRTDELGRVWYQEEVRKSATAKPRGRRVLRYNETGTVMQSVQNGEYTEGFEVAGQGPGHAAEIKVTLPSYQTGIYKDPRFPFKVHIYNDVEGFDFHEVADYYGGADMVPAECKRMYVENVLCYDIRTTTRAIQAEFRQLQLEGRIRP